MKLSEFILKSFVAERIQHAFLVPGAHIDPFISAFKAVPELIPIVACHEGGAGFMADGYARVSGRFGVTLTIGGPGITNLLTSIATAYTDGIPLFTLTGETKTYLAGRGAFQDSSSEFLNDGGFLAPLIRHKATVNDPNLIEYQMALLMRKMLSHTHRGPVNLSVPSNIALKEHEFIYRPCGEELYSPRFLNIDTAREIFPKLKNSIKVAILAGTGVIHSNASKSLVKFAERFSIPVATTLTAKGAIPEDHPLSLGHFGWYGNKRAHDVLMRGNLDCLIIIGARMHQPDTLNWASDLYSNKCVIFNDINETSPFPNHLPDLFVLGDAKTFIDYLAENQEFCQQENNKLSSRKDWLAKEVNSIDRYYDIDNYTSDIAPIHPARIACELQKVMPKETIIFSGEGAGSFIVSHYWQAFFPRSFFSPVKFMSPMGWSVAAAIGGKLANPDVPVVALTGDGSLLMHGLEIQTAARYNIPVIFLLMHNSAHGNPQLRGKKVGAFEENFLALPTHDWKQIAESLGLIGFQVSHPHDLAPVFAKALTLNKPVLIDVRCGNYPTPTYDFDQSMMHNLNLMEKIKL